MHSRVMLAVFLSVILISVALFQRFMPAPTASPTLVASNRFIPTLETTEKAIQELLIPKTASTTPLSTEPLTNTDLVGRGLIMDYIALAANGQANDATVAALADKYLVNIPNLIKAERINYSDLKVLPNTKANFQNYADEILKIHASYTQTIGGAGIPENTLTTLNPKLYSLAGIFGTAYSQASLKLKVIPVPKALIYAHIQLTNSYFSSASAMKAVSNMEEDSATGFAGLVTINANLAKEDSARAEITRILNANGI